MSGEMPLRVVYDGECPFCTAYVKMVRLRKAVGGIELIDGRGDHPVLERIHAEGLNLDDGMVVEMDGRFHHGDQAMTMMAAMTTRSGLFNRLVRLAFSKPAVARILYPPLVFGRNITLKLLGRRKIGAV